jgi:hypothetical protein
MPLQNDFLLFSAAPGANVLSQADYASAASTATGYVAGTASSAAVNKTLRQTSLMAAMIAKFIVDKVAQPVVDDGTITTIETNFIAAILAVAETMNITIPDVAGLASALSGKLDANGTAVAASRLAAARNISLNGVVVGAVNFDGSGNVAITTTTTQLAKLAGAAFTGAVSAPSFNTTP